MNLQNVINTFIIPEHVCGDGVPFQRIDDSMCLCVGTRRIDTPSRLCVRRRRTPTHRRISVCLCVETAMRRNSAYPQMNEERVEETSKFSCFKANQICERTRRKSRKTAKLYLSDSMTM